MRDRRPLLSRGQMAHEEDAAEMRMPAETAQQRRERSERRQRRDTWRGALSYFLFLLLFLGIPLVVVIHYTPFFVFQNLQCRFREKFLWRDGTVRAMEEGYMRYFHEPPLYLSEAYNRTMMWGTYEPSRIFAVKSRSLQPVTVGVAWYDAALRHPLRHSMPYVHNKVNAPRSAQKRGRDAEVMHVEWVVHDGLHYAKETVEDVGNGLFLDVELLKSPLADAWHVRMHGRMEGPSPVVMVLYVTQANMSESLEVVAPTEHNDGDWSPEVKGRMQPEGVADHTDFVLRISDDHNPLFDTAPWHVFGLQMDVESAFERIATDAVGVSPRERAAAGGRGIAGGANLAELQQQRLDLRRLPDSAFCYITEKDPRSFSMPSPGVSHNMVVLRKAYDSSFRLQLSLSPADHADSGAKSGTATSDNVGILIPRYEALSTCQLTNALRWRAKAVDLHVAKIVRSRLGLFTLSGGLYERLASLTLAEMFGSFTFTAGHYLQVDPGMDDAWEQQGRAQEVRDRGQLHLSSQRVSVMAAIGSRTDEAFAQATLTGLPLLFLTRWNKEMAKDVVASWLLGSQDTGTGFVPNRAAFNAETRSFMPRALRYEHLTFSSPPTLLLGLQELLREMRQKPSRLKPSNQRKVRNTPEYYEKEKAADEDFVRSILPALKRWRTWWHATQCGGATAELAQHCRSRPSLEEWSQKPVAGKPESLLVYRWRGRDGHTLPTSGMEDYPRPYCAGEHYREAHLDAFSWVALLSTLITQIEIEFVHIPSSVNVDWEAHLNAIHWDTVNQRYSDRIGCDGWAHSPYVGYVSLYPVLLGVVQENVTRAARTLALAQRELYSSYGLMSVSLDSVRLAREMQLPHHNMWMGYVWPSINVLFLYSIKRHYLTLLNHLNSEHDGMTGTQLQSFYDDLRRDMVETIRGGARWWEFYSPLDGRGEGSKTYVATRSLLLGLLNDFA